MKGLRLEDRGDGILALIFDRPRVKNAVSARVIDALGEALTQLEAREDLAGLIVTGAGGAFVSGGDLKELLAAHDRASGEAFCRQMTAQLDRLAALPAPVIAAIEGVALGGGMEIALACDLRFAAADATLGFRQIRLGLTPGWGGGRRLVQLVGPARARRLLWEGLDLTAARALEVGLADEVVPPGEAVRAVEGYLRGMLQRAPGSVAAVKALVEGALSEPAAVARERERELFLERWTSDAHTEAVEAFLARRRA